MASGASKKRAWRSNRVCEGFQLMAGMYRDHLRIRLGAFFSTVCSCLMLLAPRHLPFAGSSPTQGVAHAARHSLPLAESSILGCLWHGERTFPATLGSRKPDGWRFG